VNHRIRTLLIALLLVNAFLLLSCHRTKQPTTTKRYHFTGRIVSIDSQEQSAIIEGDKVPGFMDAMAMGYKIKPPATLSELAPGDSIAADLVDSEPDDDNARSDYWLENVKVTAHAKTPPPRPGATQRIPAPGDDVPDFHLTNQDGRHVSLHQYRGKVLLVTFIYTRCPFPDFCPRMSSNFAEIDAQLAADPSLASKTHLFSVSFDPEHDTPKVLRDYAFSVAHTHESALFHRWEFAVPRPADLPKMADFFGLICKPESGLITHNLSTTVIAPDGKIARWYHGSDWQVSDLIKDAAAASAVKQFDSSRLN
jgi:protein SCO1